MLYQTIQASGLSDMIASAGSLSEPTQNTIQTFAALDKRYVQVGLKFMVQYTVCFSPLTSILYNTNPIQEAMVHLSRGTVVIIPSQTEKIITHATCEWVV